MLPSSDIPLRRQKLDPVFCRDRRQRKKLKSLQRKAHLNFGTTFGRSPKKQSSGKQSNNTQESKKTINNSPIRTIGNFAFKFRDNFALLIASITYRILGLIDRITENSEFGKELVKYVIYNKKKRKLILTR